MRGREGELGATLLGATVGLLPASPRPVLVRDRRQELQLGGHLHTNVITRSLFLTLVGNLSTWVHIQRGCEDGEPPPMPMLGGSCNNLETPTWLGAVGVSWRKCPFLGGFIFFGLSVRNTAEAVSPQTLLNKGGSSFI